MELRPFKPEDAATILSWCKDKRAFRLWSADRYKDFPAKPKEMMLQYEGINMFPLTAIDEGSVVGHLLLRYPSEDKSLIRFGFVIVDDTKRGLGYGKQMLQLAMDYARRELKATTISLGVFVDNPSAIASYKSVGFAVVGDDAYEIDGKLWRGMEMQISLEPKINN